MADLDCLPFRKITNSHVLDQFLYECVDDLIGKRCIQFTNYKNDDFKWTRDDFDRAKKCIQTFYRRYAVQEQLDMDLFAVPDILKVAITRCFEVRRDQIYQALVKETLLERGCCLVENIDWRLKWILGSSDLASLREPLLHIDLYCVTKCSDENEKTLVNFEANLDQVDAMIRELSRVKQEME